MASAMACGLEGGTSHPVTPSTTVSRLPPWAVAMTGRPIAMASMATFPKASGWLDEAETTMSASSMAAGMSAQCPTNRTLSSRP